MEDILTSIKKQKRLQKFGLALISLTMSALIYNIFLLPLNIVSGGVSGVATITNHLYDIDPSLMIFILSAACSIISLMYLGFEQTAGTIVASIIYPLLVKITAPIATLIPIETNDIFIIVIFAGVLSGIASGLFYRSGYVNCGFPVICKVLYQDFKIAISKNNGFKLVLASNFPVTTPNDPPDTNIAAGLSLPFEDFNVSSAPATCRHALPKHNIINDKYIGKFVNPYIRYDITNKITPIKPIFILGNLSDI